MSAVTGQPIRAGQRTQRRFELSDLVSRAAESVDFDLLLDVPRLLRHRFLAKHADSASQRVKFGQHSRSELHPCTNSTHASCLHCNVRTSMPGEPVEQREQSASGAGKSAYSRCFGDYTHRTPR